jgi:hypothetical protein
MNTTLTVHASDVRAGFWDIDAQASYAVLMDDGNWYRSWDAYTFGAMYGWDRVALIIEDTDTTTTTNRACALCGNPVFFNPYTGGYFTTSSASLSPECFTKGHTIAEGN